MLGSSRVRRLAKDVRDIMLSKTMLKKYVREAGVSAYAEGDREHRASIVKRE